MTAQGPTPVRLLQLRVVQRLLARTMRQGVLQSSFNARPFAADLDCHVVRQAFKRVVCFSIGTLRQPRSFPHSKQIPLRPKGSWRFSTPETPFNSGAQESLDVENQR
jgi:hypothetical protein